MLISVLHSLLSADDARFRMLATQALGEHGEAAYDSGATLELLMNDPDGTVREAAALSVGRVGHHPSLPALLDIVEEATRPDRDLRREKLIFNAAASVASLGVHCAPHLPRIRRMLEVRLRFDEVRKCLAAALAALGVEAAGLIDVLLPDALDTNLHPEYPSAFVALDPRGESVYPALRRGLRDRRIDRDALGFLGVIRAYGPAAAEFVQPVSALLSDPCDAVVVESGQALAAMGEASAPALTAVIAAVGRRALMCSCGNAPLAPALLAVPRARAWIVGELASMVVDRARMSWGLGAAVLHTLKEFGADAMPALPAVVETLTDPSGKAGGDAVAVLHALDPHSPAARRALKKFVRESPRGSHARNSAKAALKRLAAG